MASTSKILNSEYIRNAFIRLFCLFFVCLFVCLFVFFFCFVFFVLFFCFVFSLSEKHTFIIIIFVSVSI